MTDNEYNQVVDLYGHRLYLMILKNIRDKEESRDLVQDSFEALWTNRKSVKMETAKSYLFTIGYRKMINNIHRRKTSVEYTSSLTVATQASTENRVSAKSVIDVAFSRLKPDFKQVLVLRDQEGYSYREIAEITGQSAPQVRTNLFRGRRKMKEIIVNLENNKPYE